MTKAAVHLISISKDFTSTLPPAVANFLPDNKAAHQTEQIWAPILAWITLSSLPHKDQADLFDKLQLRSALSETFSAIGMEGENTWRAAARVRILLSKSDTSPAAVKTEEFWSDSDVRWLTSVNESSGNTYFNKEGFEELLGWLQLPALIKTVQQSPVHFDSLTKLEAAAMDSCVSAQKAGYNLNRYLSPEPPSTSGEIEAGTPALTPAHTPEVESDPKTKSSAKKKAAPKKRPEPTTPKT
ncbi:hypothetical protein [Tunturiibacter gelidiferens]|uniref:hypothetical protein n=1 Tax=Tunturiibacter gelidiferens TaxID=3069689 RepID=UPI003D9AFEBB